MYNQFTNNIHKYNISINTRTIFFSSREEGLIDNKSINNLIKNIVVLQSISKAPINLLINSVGGSVDDVLGFYDFIKSNQIKLNIFVYGYCYSAAAVLLQCGINRIFSKHTKMLLHYGYVSHDDMPIKHAIEDSKLNLKWCNTMLSILTSKINIDNFKKQYKILPDKYLKKLLEKKGDVILTSEECLKLGLIDRIL